MDMCELKSFKNIFKNYFTSQTYYSKIADLMVVQINRYWIISIQWGRINQAKGANQPEANKPGGETPKGRKSQTPRFLVQITSLTGARVKYLVRRFGPQFTRWSVRRFASYPRPSDRYSSAIKLTHTKKSHPDAVEPTNPHYQKILRYSFTTKTS